MRDPHVVTLSYIASPSESASFDQAPPLEGTIEDIRFLLHHGQLRIEPIIHFSSVEDARRYVDPLLEAWEIDIALRLGSPELTFKYDTAEVIDRDPPPPGDRQVVLVASVGEFSLAGSVVALHVSRAKYPEPPPTFRTSPDVDTLWKRYQGYRQGREPLQSMAYFCLTLLEAITGSRYNAAKTFKISGRVLGKIGQLSSERGDTSTARKYRAITAGAPLTGFEANWLEEAVKAIIRRAGELHAIDAVNTINLNDLPSL
jgi:hypothetical protein